VNRADFFSSRISKGRIIDAHGDLRPDHICLAPQPVIIDRIEFNRDLRIMDVAEELSFLALECEMQGYPAIGQLFLDIYSERSNDDLPDPLILFYKAARAFLRAKLSIHHLLEKQYHKDKQKWRSRCENYLQVSDHYCKQMNGKLCV
jgi:aminoglycoside phosphotransferase family enzyme